MATQTTCQSNGSSNILAADTLNPCVLEAQYAVRGDIVQRANKIMEDLNVRPEEYPNFKKIIYCNIGNPQQLGQKPLSWVRQGLALADYPQLMENEATAQHFPEDIKKRISGYLAHMPGGTGAYTQSSGALVLRKDIAQAFERRDGFACSPDSVFLTDGASPGVHLLFKLTLRSKNDAYLVPIPQYPLYSATIALYGGTLLPYYLDEDNGWALNVDDIKKQLVTAQNQGLNVRGVVTINPGNPTGGVLTPQNMKEIVQLCRENQLILVADEVYQDNCYVEGKEFVSFRKVALQDQPNGAGFPVFSLHSCSKGFYGECGRRGGIFQLEGFPQDVQEQIIKVSSINLCSNVAGQICSALIMNPPKQGDASYAAYASEREAILSSLKRRATKLVTALKTMEGVTCNEPEGALYVMPRIRLPEKAVQKANSMGKPADWLYCMELLDSKGIVVVPGSGFKQAECTLHFRSTILPQEDDFDVFISSLTEYHQQFMKQYA